MMQSRLSPSKAANTVRGICGIGQSAARRADRVHHGLNASLDTY